MTQLFENNRAFVAIVIGTLYSELGLQVRGLAPIEMLECWKYGKMGFDLRLVELTLSPSCKLYEQAASL